MTRNLPYYLTGTKHWCTEAAAKHIAGEHAPAIAVDDRDGSWSVWYLSEIPRVPGQSLVRTPERPFMFYFAKQKPASAS